MSSRKHGSGSPHRRRVEDPAPEGAPSEGGVQHRHHPGPSARPDDVVAFGADQAETFPLRQVILGLPQPLRDLRVRDRFDPAENLSGQADYLARQLLRFEDVRLALAAYNSGPGRVARLGRIPDIAETRAYPRGVLRAWAQPQVSDLRSCAPAASRPSGGRRHG